jgi:cytoskeleton protein RodZ
MPGVDEQAKNEQRPGAGGPGDRLQAARIQQGLSLDDVADRMHLSANILKAIENNQFEEITAPIFVKGYLRAYARIVSLDEDDMIDQYIDFYSEEDPPIASISNTTSELSATDPRIKWTTYIVVLVIGVSLATWWWNLEQNDEAPISLDSQSGSVAEPAKSDAEVVSSEIEAVSEAAVEAAETGEASDSSVESVTATEVEPATATAVQESSAVEIEVVEVDVVEGEIAEGETGEGETGEGETGAGETGAGETGAGETGEGETAAGEIAEGQVDTAEVVEVEVAESEVVGAASGSLETEQGTRNAPARIAPVGSDKLKIIVHADTWADIKDAASYQLVYDLLRADRSVELMGQAPFTVFLGNGHGVEIMFNGEEIEVAPRIRDDNTARLKIGR